MSAPSWLDPARLPGVRRARQYSRADLPRDVGAGLAVAALMIPHGMAYAELAGVPAVTGLYTTVIALIVYAVVGPSRVLLLGPDSALAPLIAAALALVVTDGDPGAAIATAGVLALMTGVLCIAIGSLRAGAITELLSRPVQVGYLNGLAIVMVASQLGKLSGFSSSGETATELVRSFVDGIRAGSLNETTLALGLAVLAVILLLARLMPKVPAVLVGTVGAMVAVGVFDLTERDVAVVGQIPNGFPAPSFPVVDLDDVWTLTLASIGITWVMLTDTMSLSRGFAGRTGDDVDPNAEIRALGVVNVGTGLFQGFPVSGSSSRTATAHAAGGRSQLVGIVSAAAVLALLIAGGSVVELLPETALAAIVIASAVHLADAGRVMWLVRVRTSEALLSISATVGVVLVGVLEGIVIAVILSLANFIRRVWRPYSAVLGRVDRRAGYHDVGRHPEARKVPGLLLFRFDAPLFFANADHFVRRARAAIAASDEPVRRFVIAAEPITDIDTTAAMVLSNLVRELGEQGIEFGIAELKGPVKDRLMEYGLADLVLMRSYPTVGRAVSRYVRDHDVEWTDWSDA